MDDSSNINTDLLTIVRKAGLTESQARGYLALIEHGQLSPADLAEKTGESRTNGYMICEKLEKLGLASKKDGKKSLYIAQNPTNLKRLLIHRQRALKTANEELTGILPSLSSMFHIASDQPGIITAEGVEALHLVYDEIIRTNLEVLIFPSEHDRDDIKLSGLIDEQIQRQEEAKIPVRSFVQYEQYEQIKSYASEYLKLKRLPEHIVFDSQIMIFGDTVVFTTYRSGLVSTIMHSKDTASTIRNIFQALWDATQPQ